jgi:nitrite reductase/ring-hydroxylating ferredoxin subunit
MTFVKVSDAIKEGEKIGVKANGKEIMVINLDGKYYALGNKCMHRGCKLSGGKIKGNNIECPCHGSVFNIETGKVVNGPAEKNEPTFKVKLRGKEIMVDV